MHVRNINKIRKTNKMNVEHSKLRTTTSLWTMLCYVRKLHETDTKTKLGNQAHNFLNRNCISDTQSMFAFNQKYRQYVESNSYCGHTSLFTYLWILSPLLITFGRTFCGFNGHGLPGMALNTKYAFTLPMTVFLRFQEHIPGTEICLWNENSWGMYA